MIIEKSLIGDKLEEAVEAAHGETNLYDVATVVLLLFLTICAYAYQAKRRPKPAGDDVFAFFAEERAR